MNFLTQLRKRIILPGNDTTTEQTLRKPVLPPVTLRIGLPKKGGTLKPADAWAAFAADPDGRAVAESLHAKLLPHGFWLWVVGTIEDALGGAGKGETAIQSLELLIPSKTPAAIRTDLPLLAALLDWFSPE